MLRDEFSICTVSIVMCQLEDRDKQIYNNLYEYHHQDRNFSAFGRTKFVFPPSVVNQEVIDNYEQVIIPFRDVRCNSLVFNISIVDIRRKTCWYLPLSTDKSVSQADIVNANQGLTSAYRIAAAYNTSFGLEWDCKLYRSMNIQNCDIFPQILHVNTDNHSVILLFAAVLSFLVLLIVP